MALGRVFLNEQMRPWYNAGIRHLFIPHTTRLDLGQDVSRETSSSQNKYCAQAVHEPSESQFTFAPEASIATVQANVGNTLDQNTQVSGDVACDTLWRQHFSRMSERASSVWTYSELGQDMFKEPDINRRLFLQQLLPAAGMPKGSIRFWPFSMPGSTTSENDLLWFWKGIAASQASLIIIFGESAFLSLTRSASQRLKERFAHSTRLAILPSLEHLAASPAVEFLQHFLQLREYLCSCLTGSIPETLG